MAIEDNQDNVNIVHITPESLKPELEKAIKKPNSNKSVGLDGIVAEILRAAWYTGIDIIYQIGNIDLYSDSLEKRKIQFCEL